MLDSKEELKDGDLKYQELEKNILNWAKEKGILNKATPMSQSLKTLEEVNELLTAINNKDEVETKDAFGDILVTIIIGSKLCNMNLLDCLDSAYNVIKNRTGVMKNGQFIKDK